ncbi:MAG: RloB family protein, partial [Propionibacteriaceae bacterium]|jgi:hypothetical protein|nr:RloB family protein [Propionibacteriaceae bacterium]
LAVRERDADRAAARESGDPADVYDGVWMVVDVDEHAHLVRALRDADRAGVSSAVSGPCFEVWLILHLDDRRAAFTTPKAVKDHWAKLSGPTRNLPQQFAQGDGHVADAIDRAAALLAAHDRERTPRHQRNPSTEVGLLLLAISEASGENVRDL